MPTPPSPPAAPTSRYSTSQTTRSVRHSTTSRPASTFIPIVVHFFFLFSYRIGQLHSVSELEKLSGMTCVTTLVVEGNPFSQSGWDLMSYANTLRKVFPNIQTLVSGAPLHAHTPRTHFFPKIPTLLSAAPLHAHIKQTFPCLLLTLSLILRMVKTFLVQSSLTCQCQWVNCHPFRFAILYSAL